MGRSGLDKDRKFLRLARALNSAATGYGEILARGVLETLWSAAYERADDHIGDADDVEIAAKWPGARGALVEALSMAGGGGDAAGFIEPDPDRGGYRVHDLWDHAPPWVKRKAEAEAARQAAGKTLADVRREAGRKGRARQLAGKQPPVARQKESGCPANDSPGRGRAGQGKGDPPVAPAAPPGALPLFGGEPVAAPAVLAAGAFDAFAKLYPAHRRNQGKSRARKRFTAEITTPALLAQLQAALRAYLAQLERDGTDPKYVQHFGTFMGCWRDYLEVAGTETMDTRGPMERAMDDYHSARERVRGGRALDGDVELVTKWELEHPRN